MFIYAKFDIICFLYSTLAPKDGMGRLRRERECPIGIFVWGSSFVRPARSVGEWF